MRKIGLALCAMLLVALATPMASAATIAIQEFAFNVDGVIWNSNSGDLLLTGINLDSFDQTTGLGTVVISVTGVGTHSVIGFFDHEIDESVNGFFNELGGSSGSPVIGQTFEVDEPGWATPPDYLGDIYDNFLAGQLDNKIFDNSFAGPTDVSLALGREFVLGVGEQGTVRFFISTQEPSVFYLAQGDPNSTDVPTSIYLSDNLRITGTEVPEPSTIVLLLSGLGIAAVIGKFRKSA